VIAICVAYIGVQGWRWWQHRQAEEASVLYGAVAGAVRGADLPKARDAMGSLPAVRGTGYAPRGALLYAKMLWDNGDKAGARTQLSWVIENARGRAQAVARYRLAEALLDDKQYDQALATLDAKHPDAFAGLFADLRAMRSPRPAAPQRRRPPTRQRSRSSTPSRPTATTCR